MKTDVIVKMKEKIFDDDLTPQDLMILTKGQKRLKSRNVYKGT